MMDSVIGMLEPSIGNPIVMVFLLIYIGIASYTDFKEKKIRNWLNYSMLGLRIAAIPLIGISMDSVLGAVFGLLIILIPAVIMLVPMGGDIKFSAVLGSWLGGFGILFSLAVGCVTFVITGLIRKMKKKDMMALGPFISLGTLLLMIIYWVTRLC